MTTARELAERFHAGQLYGDQPYMVHLEEVVLAALQFAPPWFARTEVPVAEIEAAAWLHDSLEDTRVTPIEILAVSTPVVFAVVDAVTGIGANRRERTAHVVQTLTTLTNEQVWRIASIVKTADRYCNMRSSKATRPDLYKMYKKEWRFTEFLDRQAIIAKVHPIDWP